jgi:hypothetical protein
MTRIILLSAVLLPTFWAVAAIGHSAEPPKTIAASASLAADATAATTAATVPVRWYTYRGGYPGGYYGYRAYRPYDYDYDYDYPGYYYGPQSYYRPYRYYGGPYGGFRYYGPRARIGVGY